ncbi:LysM peptidoglycan-binding domain-containing protein [Cytobacillus suaedae]|nr:LysM peptidoglycan-binding domain-containing protein [Cytobacillus suaedae]
MEIQRFKLVQDGEHFSLEVYLDSFDTEFANELGHTDTNQRNFLQEAKKIAKEQFPNLKITTIKVLTGAMLIGVINLSDIGSRSVEASTNTYQTVPGVPIVTHVVKSGDTLSLIAKLYNVTVTDLKTFNNLNTDMIRVGQSIQIPYYSYIVVSGDTLSTIAKKLNTSVTAIKDANNLTGDLIYLGQKLVIPISKTTTVEEPTSTPTPTPTVTDQEQELTPYTVKSGDTLGAIAKNYGTTVEEIQRINNLTTTLIYPGQVLNIRNKVASSTPSEPVPTTPEEPTPDTQPISYSVIAGDTLSIIAKKFNVTVDDIKEMNNLTSDMIFVGQKLKIPNPNEQVTSTEPAPVTVQPPDQSVETITYTVVSGDTLSRIAGSYQTTVSALKEMNNLTSDMIFINQKLLIPKATVVTDQTAPITPSIDVPHLINQNNANAVTISGKTESLAKMVISITDQTGRIINQETTADIEGSFSINSNVSTLQDGNITFEVFAVDQAGNISTAIKLTVQKDVLAPTNLMIVDEGTISSSNQTAYQFSGSVAGAKNVKLQMTDEHGTVLTKEISVTDNTFNQSIDLSGLADGRISITAFAVDESGNETNTSTMELNKDTVGPSLSLVSIPSFINTNNQHAFTLSGVTEPGSTITITVTDQTHVIDKQVTADKDGNFMVIVDGRILNEGNITVETKSIDPSGNESESQSAQIIKDVTVSELVLAELTTINHENSTAYAITGKGEPNTSIITVITDRLGNTIQQSVTTDENGHFEIGLDLTSLQEGAVSIRSYQIDDAENKSNVITKVVQKDTSQPLEVIINPLETLTQQNASNYTITGTGEPENTVEITFTDNLGNEVRKETLVRADGTYNFTADLSSFSGDQLTTTIKQTDKAGNTSPETTSTAAIDNAGPQNLDTTFSSIVNSDSASNFMLTGKTEPNAKVEIEFSDGTTNLVQTVNADSEGNFTVTTDLTRFADGEIRGQIITIDTNQNKGVTKDFTVVKDTVVSDITTVELGDGRVSSDNTSAYPISGTSVEEGATVIVEITDGVNSVTETALVVDGRYHIPLDLTSLNEGSLQVTVTQQDIAGNSSNQLLQTIEKDTEISAPVITTSQLARKSTGYTYNLLGTGEAGSTVTVIIYGQSSPEVITNTYVLDETGNFTDSIDLTPLQGQKPFILINQVDSYGNSSKQQITGISSYIVGSGDNLWKISTVLGTTIEELRSMNNLTTDMIYIGQQLNVPLVAGLETIAVSEEQAFNMGYLYHGSSNIFMETMKNTQGSINVVAPTYFDINPDGSLKMTQVVDRYFIANMQSSGIRVVPFLSNHWDRALGEKALQNREQLTDQIAEAIRIYNLDGVNIDIENVTHEYRDEYTEFTKMLRAKIPADKEVSVAVAGNPRGFTVGWHGSYDYNNLALSSDYLMIMAYDESYAGSEPGPVASIGFVEKSIQYALNNGVPKEKIVLGIGHYGRYWQEGATVGGYGISNAQVAEAIKLYNGVVTFDEASKSPKATFTINEGDPILDVYGRILQPGNYTIWFENEESIKAKYELVEKYGIKGTGNWGLEQENPAFWNAFSGWVNPTVPVSGEGSQ